MIYLSIKSKYIIFNNVNHKIIQMKKIILFILICPYFLFGQVANVNFFFIEDGKEEDYLKLEEIWSEYHKQMIKEKKMFGWSLFKIESTSGDPEQSPDYMTLDRYESIEAMSSAWESFSMDEFNKLIRKKLRGKMSSKEIKKILESNPKKGSHTYTIELTDQTLPSVEMEVGEILNVDAMVQKVDDYEKYETNWAKPIFQNNVDEGNLRWWGFTKVINRNNQALEEISHFTWRIPVKGKKIDWSSKKNKAMFGGDFTFGKITDLVGDSRDILGRGKLKLIMSVN